MHRFHPLSSSGGKNAPPVLPRALLVALLLLCGTASGCKTDALPKSLGELNASYSYIPLDPLPVRVTLGVNCFDASSQLIDLLDDLPDQSVRLAVAQYDGSGNLVFGPVKTGVEGHSYQVVLDYVNVDAKSIPVYVERTAIEPGKGRRPISVFDTYDGASEYRVHPDPESKLYALTMAPTDTGKPPGDKVVIPVYVGVGLRLSASLTVTKGNANLSSLGAIAADAQAGKLTGTLVVQTMGVAGKTVSTTLPLPSELNPTTIQNSVLALGAIKAVLYDSATLKTPRVVGIYNPIGGGEQVVNGIISVLASNPVIFARQCKPR